MDCTDFDEELKIEIANAINKGNVGVDEEINFEIVEKNN